MSSHYDATAGALELGVLAAGCLWGVSCGQVWHYYHHSSDDATWIKLIVLGAWLFDTVDQGLITYSLYYYTVKNFTNPDALRLSIPELAIQTAFQGITAFLVQIFFAWRIWKLSEKNKWLATLVVSVIVVQLGLILANTVGNYKALTFDNLSQYNQLAAPIAIGISVGADLLISGLLCYYLYNGRSHDNAPSTNHIIDKLIVFSVSTGALTSICAISLLIVLLKMPETFIWVGLFFVLGRLYMNSLMAALNMRNTMRRRWTAPPVSGRSFSIHLTANPNDEVIVSPTEYALKEIQSPVEAISSKV